MEVSDLKDQWETQGQLVLAESRVPKVLKAIKAGRDSEARAFKARSALRASLGFKESRALEFKGILALRASKGRRGQRVSAFREAKATKELRVKLGFKVSLAQLVSLEHRVDKVGRAMSEMLDYRAIKGIRVP